MPTVTAVSGHPVGSGPSVGAAPGGTTPPGGAATRGGSGAAGSGADAVAQSAAEGVAQSAAEGIAPRSAREVELLVWEAASTAALDLLSDAVVVVDATGRVAVRNAAAAQVKQLADRTGHSADCPDVCRWLHADTVALPPPTAADPVLGVAAAGPAAHPDPLTPAASPVAAGSLARAALTAVAGRGRATAGASRERTLVRFCPGQPGQRVLALSGRWFGPADRPWGAVVVGHDMTAVERERGDAERQAAAVALVAAVARAVHAAAPLHELCAAVAALFDATGVAVLRPSDSGLVSVVASHPAVPVTAGLVSPARDSLRTGVLVLAGAAAGCGWHDQVMAEPGPRVDRRAGAGPAGAGVPATPGVGVSPAAATGPHSPGGPRAGGPGRHTAAPGASDPRGARGSVVYLRVPPAPTGAPDAAGAATPPREAVLAVALPGRLRGHDLDRVAALEVAATELGRVLAQEQRLHEVTQLALRDPLTGVANRRAFDRACAREVAAAEQLGTPVSLVILDLDHFKGFNDSYGHPAGDALLIDLTRAWRSQLRSGDVLARLGGEEFAILLPGTGAGAARRVADKLRDVVPQAQTCSAGVAQYPADRGGDLLELADQALYEAKRGGRNTVRVWAPPPDRHRSPERAGPSGPAAGAPAP